MGFFVGFSQAASTHMGVDLRRCQALMAQQLLHTSQIRTSVQKVRCKAVPQSVRCGLLSQTRRGDMCFQHPTDTPGRQPSAKTV